MQAKMKMVRAIIAPAIVQQTSVLFLFASLTGNFSGLEMD
jgi:hypothetical protein